MVSRGECAELLLRNTKKNLRLCTRELGGNFRLELVIEVPLNLHLMLQDHRYREIVIPRQYKTKTGALYKARALQYCLSGEDNELELNSEDWIVHLDEETLLTRNALNGIVNFCLDGKHQIGQGVIIYTDGQISNWITTLMESNR